MSNPTPLSALSDTELRAHLLTADYRGATFKETVLAELIARATTKLSTANTDLRLALHGLLNDVSDLSDDARAGFGGEDDKSVTFANDVLAKHR